MVTSIALPIPLFQISGKRIARHYQVEVIIINRKPEMSEEEELVQDVLEIIQVFAARLYGRRSHRNQKLIEDLQKATLANIGKSQ